MGPLGVLIAGCVMLIPSKYVDISKYISFYNIQKT